MLVLAIFFIFLATSLATLIMAGSAQLIRTAGHEHEAILLRQMIDSGRAWALSHTPRPAAPVALSGADLLPEGSSGEVRIDFDPNAGDVVVTAALKRNSRELSQTSRFRLPW
jgi:hypothetical protein